MTTPVPPVIDCEYAHAGLAVTDIPAAVDFYTKKLAFKLGFTWGDPPTFAGVTLGSVQMFLQKGAPDPKDCSVYFFVGDADELYEFHRANGVQVAAEIGDREYGIRDYTIRDLHGYYLTFGHNLFNAGPPIEIERVDVPVRWRSVSPRCSRISQSTSASPLTVVSKKCSCTQTKASSRTRKRLCATFRS